ncbi:MAG: T9SS type A sorting domain-containing protein [Bacteroidia bacterium]|nr:T9SS type A sorting domain-containing protein [Bacteroidia bacterium]
MRRQTLIHLACWTGALLWAQPDLFFNQGALVYVQSGALVYVQGGMQTNDNGTNNGVLENLGTIRCVDGSGTYRGHFKIGQGAEVNSRPNSWIYVQGNYENKMGSHRSTGSHNAYGNTALGGTVEFNGTSRPQSIYIGNTSNNPQDWTFYDVRINNTNTSLAGRFVAINCEGGDFTATGTFTGMCINDSDRDIWIGNTLTFISGRIHTAGYTLSSGAPAEVRVLNPAANAVVRTPWAPAQPASFATLDPDNQDRYVYGYLRRNVAAATAYPFAVGAAPTGTPPNGYGLQGVEVTPAAAHYVRVRFDPTVQAPFTQPPYCRPGDSGPSRQYNPLNNGRWEIMPFAAVDATTPSTPSGPSSVRMYNRTVTNATTNGNCPAAGTSTGLPGGSDPVWNNYPTNLCYVGYNQAPAGGLLTPPNNCEGSPTGWDVTRTGFTSYNQNGTYFYATVIAHNAPLPSEDIRLAAAPAGTAIALTWEVSPERPEILGYELYRSTDGVAFTRIAQIDKQGRTRYTHRDEYVKPLTRYFYRVEQHDIFGNIRYSNTVEAMLPGAGESFSVQLQPNPVVTEAQLLVSLPAEGPVSFQLYDAAGKLVVKSDYTLAAGTHTLDLSGILSQVAAGNYNAVVSYGGEVRTIRLIKADMAR